MNVDSESSGLDSGARSVEVEADGGMLSLRAVHDVINWQYLPATVASKRGYVGIVQQRVVGQDRRADDVMMAAAATSM